MSSKVEYQFKPYDDCDWQYVYPAAHEKQTKEILEQNKAMVISNFEMSDKLTIYDNTHENQLLLYKLMYYLQPESIFEVGCGYCNHLLSIRKLCPDTKLYGCDISYIQYMNALKYFPELEKADIELYMGKDFKEWNDTNQYDIVYTNAVLMHMSTNNAIQCLINMYNITKKLMIVLDGGLMVPREAILHNFKNIFIFDEFADKFWELCYMPPLFIFKDKVDTNIIYKVYEEILKEKTND